MKHYQITKILTSLILIISLSSIYAANESSVPKPFRGQDNKSTISINYDDYSEILKLSVLDMGISSRKKSSKSTAKIGSRFKSKRKSHTAYEGNRFLFDNFKDNNNLAVLTTIRKSLEQVPNEISMSMLNSKEQLAYWLNIYNISLLEQLISIYPNRNIEDELYGNDGIMNNKFLEISGVKLSLNDIHMNIVLGKFSANPVVIYGFFQGTIGGPNIRSRAYTGQSVIGDLQKNAREFINSNRGTFRDKKGSLKVSSYYDTNRHIFPSFNTDLKKHLKYYVDDKYLPYLEQAKKFKPTLNDMNIVDINGGQREFSSSAATNEAAFIDSTGRPEVTGVQTHFDGTTFTSETTGVAAGGGAANAGFSNPAANLSDEAYRSLTESFGRYSAQQMEILQELNRKRKLKEGVVKITEEPSK